MFDDKEYTKDEPKGIEYVTKEKRISRLPEEKENIIHGEENLEVGNGYTVYQFDEKENRSIKSNQGTLIGILEVSVVGNWNKCMVLERNGEVRRHFLSDVGIIRVGQDKWNPTNYVVENEDLTREVNLTEEELLNKAEEAVFYGSNYRIPE